MGSSGSEDWGCAAVLIVFLLCATFLILSAYL